MFPKTVNEALEIVNEMCDLLGDYEVASKSKKVAAAEEIFNRFLEGGEEAMHILADEVLRLRKILREEREAVLQEIESLHRRLDQVDVRLTQAEARP